MSDTKNYPLASFLQVIVVQGNQQDLALDPTSAAAMSERTIKAAQVFIGALPILLVYPFLQEIFCYRACDGSGEGVTQPESIALDTPERGMGLMIKYLIGGEKE